MKAKFVKYGNLRNDEHFQYNTEFSNLVAASGAETLKIKPQHDAYLPLYGEEDTALKKIVRSAITAEIEAADHAEAAARLQIVFDTYGNLAARTLNEETSGIYNLLQELNGKYAGDVQAIGLAGWVAKLEADNNALAQRHGRAKTRKRHNPDSPINTDNTP